MKVVYKFVCDDGDLDICLLRVMIMKGLIEFVLSVFINFVNVDYVVK